MLEDLRYLVQLQEIDLRIKEQELAQEQYPAQVEKLNAQINTAIAALEAVKTRLEKAELDKKNWEEQVVKAQAGLERSQERLNSIKTNREYDAVHAEIEAQKNIINGAEQHRNNLSAEIERLQTTVTEHQDELDRITAENNPLIDDLKSKIGAIDSTIATITKERDVVIPNLSKPVLRQYDLIRSKRKTGRAISIIKPNRTCSICYKVLEPQLFNEIKRGIKVQLCQSCGSIMIWDPPESVTQ
jgi:predicted  nucleic acid-binding Zn-ribbon protein